MRIARLLLFSSAVLAVCFMQTATAQQVSANFLIAKASPAVSASKWKTADGRDTIATEINGSVLRGYIYEGSAPHAPALLFFNGEGVLLNDADSLYRSLAALGPTVVVYDYRGTGFSDGKPDVAGFRDDAVAIYDKISADLFPHRGIAVYGFSMGSAFAAYVATQRPVTALILAAPIASASDELQVYARLLGNPLAGSTPSPEAVQILNEPSLVAQSQAPLLVIHSSSDILVPVGQGQKVFAASSAPAKQLILLPSTPHGATPASPAAIEAVKQLFITLSGPAK